MDREEIGLSMEPGDLRRYLPNPFLERPITLPKPLGADGPIEVQPVCLVHLCPEPRFLGLQGLDQSPLFAQGSIGLAQVRFDVLGGKEEAVELLTEYLLEIQERNFRSAFTTHVLR